MAPLKWNPLDAGRRVADGVGGAGGGEASTLDTRRDGIGAAGEDALQLLRAQATLYGRLEGLAARQRDLVTSDDPEPLLALLNDRRKLAAELAGVVRRFEPLRRDWRTFRGELTAAERAEADGLLDDIRRRLQRVMESDERDARLLSARKVMTAAGLRAAVGSSDALSAYAAAPTSVAPRREYEAE